MVYQKTSSKQSFRKTEPFRHNPNYKIKYPGFEAYHFPKGPSHNSPNTDSFWRSQPIRQGKKIDYILEGE